MRLCMCALLTCASIDLCRRQACACSCAPCWRAGPWSPRASSPASTGSASSIMYVPELGLELRIESEEIQPAPVVTDWNKDARRVL